MEEIRMQQPVCILSNMQNQTHKEAKCIGVLAGAT